MSEVKKHPGGRPPAYKDVEEMQKLVDDYFKDCEGVLLTNKEGEPILNKYGEVVYAGKRPPTVTGLALALGFNSRQSLLNYEAKKEFMDTIIRAKSKIEEYNETRLFDREGVNGAKFSLINNFKSWKEKQDVELSGSLGVKIVDDIE